MDGTKAKRNVWVENFSLDLHEGRNGKPDYILITRHDKKEKHRLLVPVPLVKEITEALQSLAN